MTWPRAACRMCCDRLKRRNSSACGWQLLFSSHGLHCAPTCTCDFPALICMVLPVLYCLSACAFCRHYSSTPYCVVMYLSLLYCCTVILLVLLYCILQRIPHFVYSLIILGRTHA